MSRACVILAQGFEEIEAVTVIDVLRRAGIEVLAATVKGLEVTGSHGITLRADSTVTEVLDEEWDLIVLPGGMPGAQNLRDNEDVQRLIKQQHMARKRIAAICAAPIALSAAGILAGRRATSYPSFKEQLGDVHYIEEPVVVDGHITTSRGVGTALSFALKLVEELAGYERALDLKTRMLIE